MNKLISKLIGVSLFCVIVGTVSLFKLSFVLGSHEFFFSGINFILPLLGAFFSLPFSIGLIFALFGIKALFGFGVLTLGLPTLFASLRWFEKLMKNKFANFGLNVLLPLGCMALFVSHPVAGKSFLYSFYWLIPVALYFSKRDSVFSAALSSTFIAHAVGSIIWLYIVPMTSGQWMALIPVVAVERLTMSCGMSVLFYVLRRVECQKRFIHMANNQYLCPISGK